MARRSKSDLIFEDNFLKVKGQLALGSEKALLAATVTWHKGVVKILTGARSGRIYQIPGTKKDYTASAPGEAPAVRLGDLRTSYRFVIKKYEGLIGSPLAYALDLEKGTSHMAPRPHLTAAYLKNRREIQSQLSKDWLT
jgi:hypothetical protein